MSMRLSFAQFIGESRRTRDAGGFRFHELSDTPRLPVPRHMHEDPHFVIVLRGTYHTSAGNVNGETGPGTLIYNPAGTTHQDHFTSYNGQFLTVSISPDRLRGLREAVRHPLEGVSVELASPQAKWLSARVQEEFGNIDPATPLVLEGLALQLVAHVTRQSRLRSIPAWVTQAAELIEDRCGEAITVHEIAEVFGVHPWHLTRCFRAAYQCAPGEYLRHCRAKRALSLLRNTSVPISEIALRCGFADQSQFTRSFRRTLGVTPKVIRSRR